MSSYLLFIETNVSMNYIYVSAPQTTRKAYLCKYDINDTSHHPLLSLYIPITHLSFLHLSPPSLYNGNYTCTLHPPPNAQIWYRLLSTENQSINGFDVLLYAICTCNGKPASHLFSSLTATCIQGTSQGAFLQEWICHLGTKPSDA